jgi:hypothetical protein
MPEPPASTGELPASEGAGTPVVSWEERPASPAEIAAIESETEAEGGSK